MSRVERDQRVENEEEVKHRSAERGDKQGDLYEKV